MLRSKASVWGSLFVAVVAVYSAVSDHRSAVAQRARATEFENRIRELTLRLNEPSRGLPANVTQAAEAAPTSAPTVDQTVLARAQSLVENAVAAETWGDPQALEFRTLLPQLSDSDRDSLLRTVVRAINDGKVKVLTRAMPF